MAKSKAQWGYRADGKPKKKPGRKAGSTVAKKVSRKKK